jgi:hypothetical protein
VYQKIIRRGMLKWFVDELDRKYIYSHTQQNSIKRVNLEIHQDTLTPCSPSSPPTLHHSSLSVQHLIRCHLPEIATIAFSKTKRDIKVHYFTLISLLHGFKGLFRYCLNTHLVLLELNSGELRDHVSVLADCYLIDVNQLVLRSFSVLGKQHSSVCLSDSFKSAGSTISLLLSWIVVVLEATLGLIQPESQANGRVERPLFMLVHSTFHSSPSFSTCLRILSLSVMIGSFRESSFSRLVLNSDSTMRLTPAEMAAFTQILSVARRGHGMAEATIS